MKYIQATKEINKYIKKYPNARATKATIAKRQIKGVNYADYEIGIPLMLEKEKYEFLAKQLKSYINICEQLCYGYNHDRLFRALVKKLVLNFEDKYIAHLIENYPLATMSGCRFGTDTMIDTRGNFKTVEVNLGPPGGPPESIKIEEIYNKARFAISPETYINHFIFSLDFYYRKVCYAAGITQKPFKKRHYVIVENAEWTPGNFIYLDLLRENGMNINIAPMDAFKYNEKENTLTLKVDDKNLQVDVVILYCHLQDDYRENGDPGDLIKALHNKAVFADTSIFPIVVLASKSMAGLISQMARDPNNFWPKRLMIKKSDLLLVKDMFPITHHWEPSLFKKLENEGLNKFRIIEFLTSQKYIVKSTDSRYFAGQGVFGADHKKGRKGYAELVENLGHTVTKVIMSQNNIKVLQHLITNKFIFKYSTYAMGKNVIDRKKAIVFQKKLYAKLKNFSFVKDNDVHKFIRIIAVSLLEIMSEIRPPKKTITTIVSEIINYVSTYLLLPYVLQEKIISEIPYELRVSGFIGDTIENHLSIISSLKPLSPNGKNRPLHVYIPDKLPTFYKSLSRDPLSKIIENHVDKNPISVKNIFSHLKLKTNSSKFLVLEHNNVKYLLSKDIYLRFDLITVLGNLLSTFSPKKQEKILRGAFRSLANGGIIAIELLDISKFKESLEEHGPVLSKTTTLKDHTYERLVKNYISNSSSDSSYNKINQITSSIVDNMYETAREKKSIYVQSSGNTLRNLKKIGFVDIEVKNIYPDDRHNDSKDRLLVFARKILK